MILFGDTTDVSGGGVWSGGGSPHQEDIRRREGGAGWDKNKYVTIINRAYVPEGSLSNVVTPPSHNSYIPHILLASNIYTHMIQTETGRSLDRRFSKTRKFGKESSLERKP